jgi:thiosulfate dehydrogenase [quinone] large subunit
MQDTNNKEIRLRRQDVILAYTLLRIALGINFFVHGLVRIGDIPGFAQSQVSLYADIPSPDLLIRIFAYLIPPVELIVGLLVTIGLLTRQALIVGFALMVPLIFGTCLLQNWTTAGLQLVYCLVYFILLAGCSLNTISVDRLRQR